MRRMVYALVVLLGLGCWSEWGVEAKAQQPQNMNIGRYFHYPYYYFPHNYWPTNGPKWPEPVGAPYMRPPAYMAYPPFREPHWRYPLWEPKSHYRGFHFWLDQF